MSFFDENFPLDAQRLKVSARKKFWSKAVIFYGVAEQKVKTRAFQNQAFLRSWQPLQPSHVFVVEMECYRTEKSPICQQKDVTTVIHVAFFFFMALRIGATPRSAQQQKTSSIAILLLKVCIPRSNTNKNALGHGTKFQIHEADRHQRNFWLSALAHGS